MEFQRIELADGAYLQLAPRFLSPAESAALLTVLRDEIPFEQRAIRVFGREVMQPRLTAWIGEPEAVYKYSGTVHEPLPFGKSLRALHERVRDATGEPFNSVLCNLYRDGMDAMGMHSDSEPELGEQPVVASLSLGATRRFVLKHRSNKASTLDLPLDAGSLLVMRGTTQRFYKHGVPRERAVSEPRINLTFRSVHSRAR